MKELVNVGVILTPEHLPHVLRPPQQSTFYDTDIADILRMGNRANRPVWHETMIIQVLQGSKRALWKALLAEIRNNSSLDTSNTTLLLQPKTSINSA